MKANDPKLTAFVLGELDAEESRTIKLAMQQDQSIAQEVSAIQEMVNLLNEGYQNQEVKLSAEHRAKVFAAGSEAKIEDIQSLKRRHWLPWAGAATAVAAAIALIFNFTQQNGDTGEEFSGTSFAQFHTQQLSAPMGIESSSWSGDTSSTQATLSSPIRQALSKSPSSFHKELTQRASTITPPNSGEYKNASWVDTNDQASTTLPMLSGNLSWQWIQNAIETNQNIHPSIIRTEEIINAVPTRFSQDFSAGGVSAHLELLPCPWNANAVLAVAQFKNDTNQTISQVSTGMTFAPSVKRFRILGYRDSAPLKLSAPTNINLEPGFSHSIICEIDFAQKPSTTESLVTLHLATKTKNQSVPYNYNEQAAENTTSTSAALAYWAQWAGKALPTPELSTNNLKTYLQKSLTSAGTPEAKEALQQLINLTK